MAATDTAASILSELERAGEPKGIDIVDVEVVGATKAPTVRVRIDWLDETKDSISLDEVAKQTSWISDLLDEVDPFSGSYTLEVSSPGLDRPLRRAHDFERFAGQEVSLTTTATEGRKRFSGTLVGFSDGKVSLESDEGIQTFALDEIKRCTIKPNFDELSKKN